MKFDTVLKGGTVVDGTGIPRYKADIGIKDGVIAKIGKIDIKDSDKVLDAEGQIVAPGFVDVHTHLDGQIFWDPYCTTAGWHGVTSVVIGNCGFGFAPCVPELRDRVMLMMTRNEQIPFNTMKEGMPWDWESFPEYLDSVDATPKGVNCLALMPVSPLMVHVMGLEESKSGRPPTEAEVLEMQRLLDEGYQAGACGWSAQRAGEKSMQADYDGSPFPSDVMGDELCLSLGEVSSRYDYGAIQISPLENPGEYEDFSEIFLSLDKGRNFSEKLASVSGRPILHNIISTVPSHPEILTESIQWLNECNARGNCVIGQGATLRASMEFSLELCQMFDASDEWRAVFQGSKEEQLARIRNPEIRAKMLADSKKAGLIISAAGGFEPLTISSVGTFKEFEHYVGKTLGEVAKERGETPIEAMLALSDVTNFDIEFSTGYLLEDVDGVAQMMKSSYIVAGPSDGGAHTKMTAGGGFGTDLIIWAVREHEKLTLEEAHYRLSYLPAKIMGMKNRGYLHEGAAADIIVYDYENLQIVPGKGDYEKVYDFPANEWRRVNKAVGISYTIVNGEVTFKDGDCTQATPGALLRHGRMPEKDKIVAAA